MLAPLSLKLHALHKLPFPVSPVLSHYVPLRSQIVCAGGPRNHCSRIKERCQLDALTELSSCVSLGGYSGLPALNKPDGLCERKATPKRERKPETPHKQHTTTTHTHTLIELRGCVNRKVALPSSYTLSPCPSFLINHNYGFCGHLAA